jgi:ribulose-5-phosphate 4-epimerase/fuculose-1-phosphate aldolase
MSVTATTRDLSGVVTDAGQAGVATLAEPIATACQVLAETGLAPNVLGHVSVRLADGDVLIRCRGPRERGLAFTTAEDARRMSLAGRPLDAGEWSVPNEWPIHTAVLRRRPDVSAVVHAHPAAVVTMSLAGLPWLPIVGAYDIPAARIAAGGIPVWPRAVLVDSAELGDDLASCLADRPVAVLHGHGLVAVGTGDPEHALAEAVTNAVAVDSLARMILAVRAAGAAPAPIADEDLAGLPDLGSGFTVETMWRHLVARTAARHRAVSSRTGSPTS